MADFSVIITATVVVIAAVITKVFNVLAVSISVIIIMAVNFGAVVIVIVVVVFVVVVVVIIVVVVVVVIVVGVGVIVVIVTVVVIGFFSTTLLVGGDKNRNIGKSEKSQMEGGAKNVPICKKVSLHQFFISKLF